MATPCRRARGLFYERERAGALQTFTYTAALYVNDNPNTGAYAANRFWNWEVDVSSSGQRQHRRHLAVPVPLESPPNNSTDVSVYTHFQWEASPPIIPPHVTGTETIYVLDPYQSPASGAHTFYNTAGTHRPNRR